MKTFGGPVLFLDRSDINTDEIIPAKYLNETDKESLAEYCLEDLELEGFTPGGEAMQKANVIVTRGNFGCGSSREHAPWALEVNDITLVVAPSFARIFRRNMYNCGMLAVEISEADTDRVFSLAGKETVCTVGEDTLTFTAGDETVEVPFKLEGFDKALVESGGWVEFADKRY